MTEDRHSEKNEPEESRQFPETTWTKILSIQTEATPKEDVERIVAELCEAYWFPVYSYARRLGSSPHDAEDLTQGFFENLLQEKLFLQADRTRGRLRTFLRAAFENYIGEQRRAASRLKRGGNRRMVPFDEAFAESELTGSLGLDVGSDAYFDRAWAKTLFRRATNTLRTEYHQRGQSQLFDALFGQIMTTGEPDCDGENIAKLGLQPGTVRVSVHRLRQRFRRVLESEIGETLDHHSGTTEELRYLVRALDESSFQAG